jgi:hypothetical protein
MPFGKNTGNGVSYPRSSTLGGTNTDGFSTQSIGTIFPTCGNNFPLNGRTITNIPVYNSTKSAKGHITNSNPILFPADQIGGPANNVPYTDPLLKVCLN